MIDFEGVIALAGKAGEAVMRVYAGTIEVEVKSDETPITRADREAHAIIREGLARLTPEVPLLSEEGEGAESEGRRGWKRYWLVDPLDGTKEFIGRNGQFTVNIALIEDGEPSWGVVHAPALARTWHGGRAFGAHRIENGVATTIRVRPRPEGGLTGVKSRSHPSRELDAFYRALDVTEEKEIGSSLKFCLVAQGDADVYARFGPTMEWDTAAGQAVVEGAGGRVVAPDGRRLAYNKENLKNPHFIVDAG